MVTNNRKLISLREAIIDTALAVLTNTPINFLVIAIAFHYEWTATFTSIILTIIFTILAIIRKTWLRLKFYEKYGG